MSETAVSGCFAHRSGGRWLAANVVPVLESVPMLQEFGWDRVDGREPADAG